ncbi:hypothetical protein PQX77_001781 [Marasmius sp. AFHP31]|nr:hypothetical protein PQX77_001781 [Marasmius sp. AFHP31]
MLPISALKSLSDAIAGVGASHKAEHQFSRGACLPGTRESALAAIDDWASAKGPEASLICWLSGAAGVGKSAIALSIAKSFEDGGLLSSSFFFFRSDSKRNNPAALVLTMAHDLAITTPLVRNCIEQRVSADPKILEASLEQQYRELVIAPTLMWNRQRSLWGTPVVPNIVIIDGLDECGDEPTQLRVLSIIQSTYQQTPHSPLRFLICSRPEAWIQEAFSDEPLLQLSRNIVLDDSLEAREDIRRYYRHHFREIATSRKYRQVRFPNPWPSERDLEILVERSCAQFVYASTLVKFIQLAYNHPIVQLSIILDSRAVPRSSKSPYHDLDCLYHVILSANSDHDELILILVAIIVLSDHFQYSKPCPAMIEAILGLPSGQVALTLRGMYSVLKIGDWKDPIELYHTSFRDYLVDHDRSYIDIAAQKHVIACRWLQRLSTEGWQSLSEDQWYYIKNYRASRGWISLCTSIPQPTWDLLDNLWRVDLAAVFTGARLQIIDSWTEVFQDLVPWVKKYPCHTTDNCNKADLVEALVHRLQELPREHESDDPQHVAYQNVCMEYAQALTREFADVLTRGITVESGLRDMTNVGNIFLTLTQSALLKHCRLGMELFLLCRTFFELVKGYPFIFELVREALVIVLRKLDEPWFLRAWRGTANLLEWTETFPEKYAEEGKALKAQVLAFPWPKLKWKEGGYIVYENDNEDDDEGGMEV